MTKGVAAVILAAGSSTRLGHPKQFVVYRGKPLILRAAEAAINAGCSPVIVVTGRDHKRVIETLAGSGATAVHNRAWEQGVGTSIHTGIEALVSEAPNFAAILLMVCDQPFVSEGHLRTLIEIWRHQNRGAIIASSYCETLGTPAFFDRRHAQKLRELPPEQGAKFLFTSQAAETIGVAFAGGGFDIDTPQDYQALRDAPLQD